MAKTNNLAYDLSVYEPVPEKEHRKRIQHKRNLKPKDNISAVKSLMVGITALCLLCAILNGKLEISKLYAESSQTNSKLSQLQSENVRLDTEIEAKTSVPVIENYAENVLGMEKLNKAQIEYIQTDCNNVVEVVNEKDEGLFNKIGNKLKSIVEYIGT